MSKQERREWALFESRVRHQLIPKIRASAHTICIAPSEPDVKAAVELGYMILLDKPILTVVPEGTTCPEHLRRVSDLVLENMTTEETAEAIAQWMRGQR